MSRFNTLNQLKKGTCGHIPFGSKIDLSYRINSICKTSECGTCTIPATREQEEVLGDKDE